MPKVLFIAAHRPGRSPSQRFRFEQYLDFLKDNGFSYNFSYLLSEKDDRSFYQKGEYFTKFKVLLKSATIRIYNILCASHYDIIFVQREAFMTGTTFFEKAFNRSGAKLIFDFDDSIWLSNVSDANQNLEWMKDYAKTGHIIEMADLVIAGNSYLANYALNFNKKVTVIPTTIDTFYHKRKNSPSPTLPEGKGVSTHENTNSMSGEVLQPADGEDSGGAVNIGWTGTSTTLKHFNLIIPVLETIKKKYREKVQFKVVVDAPYKNEMLALNSTIWNKESEIEDLSTIDIGIMPLPDNDWARGKCGFKGLQYMALEIPTIMSPVGVNSEIIEDGRNGFLASIDNEWIEKLSLLIESKELRNRLGKAARKTVEERYSVESQKQNYLDCFNKVMQMKK